MGPYAESLRSRIGPGCILLPGVRAILLNQREEVLLQYRSDLACWGLPAGAVELDETVLGALRREVLEETGLVVEEALPMALYSGPGQRYKYPNGDEVQGFALTFLVRKWTGEPRADGVEGSEVRFWPLNALPKNLVAIHARTLADLGRYSGTLMLPEES